jgi:hypothetical protein
MPIEIFNGSSESVKFVAWYVSTTYKLENPAVKWAESWGSEVDTRTKKDIVVRFLYSENITLRLLPHPVEDLSFEISADKASGKSKYDLFDIIQEGKEEFRRFRHQRSSD